MSSVDSEVRVDFLKWLPLRTVPSVIMHINLSLVAIKQVKKVFERTALWGRIPLSMRRGLLKWYPKDACQRTNNASTKRSNYNLWCLLMTAP